MSISDRFYRIKERKAIDKKRHDENKTKEKLSLLTDVILKEICDILDNNKFDVNKITKDAQYSDDVIEFNRKFAFTRNSLMAHDSNFNISELKSTKEFTFGTNVVDVVRNHPGNIAVLIAENIVYNSICYKNIWFDDSYDMTELGSPHISAYYRYNDLPIRILIRYIDGGNGCFLGEIKFKMYRDGFIC